MDGNGLMQGERRENNETHRSFDRSPPPGCNPRSTPAAGLSGVHARDRCRVGGRRGSAEAADEKRRTRVEPVIGHGQNITPNVMPAQVGIQEVGVETLPVYARIPGASPGMTAVPLRSTESDNPTIRVIPIPRRLPFRSPPLPKIHARPNRTFT